MDDLDGSAERLQVALETIGWSLRELSRRLGSDYSTIRKMAHGRRHIPPALLDWLASIAAAMAAVPVDVSGNSVASAMSGDELLQRLNAIGWDLPEAARRGARNREHLRQMLHDQRPISAAFGQYVCLVEAAVAAQPDRPAGWGGRGRHVAGGTAQAPPVI